MPSDPDLLVDTMIVIEAVRTGVWNAITGRRRVVTAPECADELRRGGPETVTGYVPVTDAELARLVVEPVSDADRARLQLAYPRADGLDPGERDLLALAAARCNPFELCSCDKAAVKAAHELGLLDRTVSLESVADRVGARAGPPFRSQYSEARMGQWRTSLLLGRPL
jgi:hypothetical protein